ncbi:NAD(P)H-binding protein [Sinomonas sp. ASV322]|uniref:SDR family oxidoreductase n=1 Tax=Sinomonas sp. ASV322 TaxID=3041920 RepID=UPI0027DC9CE9|nr:NAD(P)H-binding protein [Sinomonas sp. ASV322]MDQ4501352.1 NAD(P)H-binding protein [Sinomonas sp. ASV322]
MILVAGGTGRLGRRLVADLADAGEAVRTFSRGISQPIPEEAHDGVERVRGDLASGTDCERAVDGVRKVVFAASGFGLARGGDPRSVDRDGALRLTAAAAQAGVEHIVMMSMVGAAPDAPLEFLRMKHAAEEAVKTSGVAWTVIRLGASLEQQLDVLGGALASKGIVPVFGSGRADVTFTSTADAAGIVRRALADPALRNRSIEWGSETHTFNGLAAALVARAGRGHVRRIPIAALRAMGAVARPFSPFMARMAEAALWMDSGGAAFDVGPTRAEFPDLPITGLAEVLRAMDPQTAG